MTLLRFTFYFFMFDLLIEVFEKLFSGSDRINVFAKNSILDDIEFLIGDIVQVLDDIGSVMLLFFIDVFVADNESVISLSRS